MGGTALLVQPLPIEKGGIRYHVDDRDRRLCTQADIVFGKKSLLAGGGQGERAALILSVFCPGQQLRIGVVLIGA